MEHIIKQTKDLEATVASLTTGSGNNAHLLALLDQFKQAVAQSSGNKDNDVGSSLDVHEASGSNPASEAIKSDDSQLTIEVKSLTRSQISSTDAETGNPPHRRSKRKLKSVKASTKYDQKTKSGRNKTTNSDLDKNDIHLPKANRDERESIDDLKDEECLYQRSPEQDINPVKEEQEDAEEETVEAQPFSPLRCKLCEVDTLPAITSNNVHNEITVSPPITEAQSCQSSLSADQSESQASENSAPIFWDWTALCDHVKERHCILSGYEEDGYTVADNNLYDKDSKLVTRKKKVMRYSVLTCPRCKWSRKVGSSYQDIYFKLCFHLHTKHMEELPSHITVLQCLKCDYKTYNQHLMDEHVSYNHSDEPTSKNQRVTCTECGKLILQRYIARHMLNTHKLLLDQNQLCDMKDPVRSKCPHCDQTFSLKHHVERHISRVHKKEKDHLCHICSSPFFAYRDLISHLYMKHELNIHNKTVLDCPVEGCSFSTLNADLLVRHNTTQHCDKVYICVHCVKTFKTLHNLKQHETIMHPSGSAMFFCDKCDFKSHAEQYLKRHVKIHSAEKQHKCKHPGCSYASHFKENVNKHSKVHVDGYISKRKHDKESNQSVPKPTSKSRRKSNPTQSIPELVDQLEESHYNQGISQSNASAANTAANTAAAPVQQIINSSLSQAFNMNLSSVPYIGVDLLMHPADNLQNKISDRMMVLPMSGPSHQGQTHQGQSDQGQTHQGPSNQDSSHHGPSHHGPSHQGQTHQGASHQGQTHQGQTHPGQTHQGPSHQGPSHQGPTHQGQTPQLPSCGGGQTTTSKSMMNTVSMMSGRAPAGASHHGQHVYACEQTFETSDFNQSSNQYLSL